MHTANQVNEIVKACLDEMKEGVHYGRVAGIPKPFLWQPGAELIAQALRMSWRFKLRRFDLGNDHLGWEACCVLTDMDSNTFLSEGMGICSTKESKYRWRNACRSCPSCGATAIIRGRVEYGGGWVCFRKNGGCGAKFAESDPAIINQPEGRVENPDIADTYNTVLKMACKRAFVNAVKGHAAVSAVFSQDDPGEPETDPVPATPPPSPPPAQPKAPPSKPANGSESATNSGVALAIERAMNILADREQRGEITTLIGLREDLRGLVQEYKIKDQWREVVFPVTREYFIMAISNARTLAEGEDVLNELMTAEAERMLDPGDREKLIQSLRVQQDAIKKELASSGLM